MKYILYISAKTEDVGLWSRSTEETSFFLRDFTEDLAI